MPDHGGLGVADDIAGGDDPSGIDAPEKGPHIVVGRILQNLFRRAHLHHPTAFHDGDPVTDAQRLVEVMGDKDDGPLMAVLQLEQLVLHLGTDQGIERRKRLIHQQDIRIDGQAAGQPHPLLHAARELVGIGVLPSFQPDLLQRIHGPLVSLVLFHPVQLQAEGNVVNHRLVRHQGKGLKDHAGLGAPVADQFALRHLQYVLAIHQDLARRRLDEPVEHADQGRLA